MRERKKRKREREVKREEEKRGSRSEEIKEGPFVLNMRESSAPMSA